MSRGNPAAYDYLLLYSTDPLTNMPCPRTQIALTHHSPSPSETPNRDVSIPPHKQASPVFFLFLLHHQLARGRSPCRLPGPTKNGGRMQGPWGMCPDQSSRYLQGSGRQIAAASPHNTPPGHKRPCHTKRPNSGLSGRALLEAKTSVISKQEARQWLRCRPLDRLPTFCLSRHRAATSFLPVLVSGGGYARARPSLPDDYLMAWLKGASRGCSFCGDGNRRIWGSPDELM